MTSKDAESASGGLRGQGRLGLLDQLGKVCSIMNGDIGEDLAIELDAGLLEAVDELRVAGSIQLAGSRDAHDP